uniref:von Willebrand factor n=1 Tax=Mastacembelus armatus TaxID=205130 RepID=A0A3Q3S0D4_9TELE
MFWLALIQILMCRLITQPGDHCTYPGTTGRCSLFGRHHVHTFDGVLYKFPGDCSYLLAGDCNFHSFTLLGDFIEGKRTGVTLFLGDAFELHLSVDGRLSEGEKRLSLPYASHSVFVGSELGFYKLWSEEFGFTVTIDNAANIALTLTKHHANRTCGLCGNFNSISADEYTAQEGFLTEDSYDFANSWAVKGADQSCQRVSNPSESCNNTKETSAILSSCSVLQTSSVFTRCAHLVSPEAFLLLCQEAACHCDTKDGEDCYCPFLLEYARTCHAHGKLLQGWLEESQCFPKCPIGMQYSECTKSCSTTCHSLNIQEVCKEECVDGCTCPVGKVLDGSRCVEVSQCSCVHMGRHFPAGSTISQDCNTCVCRHGSWECTNEGCPGECLVVGQSHFKTFDNKFFTFTGRCQYLLARDCTDREFSVIIENVQCADDQDAVCTRSVTLSLPSLEDMTVKLKHGGIVSVNSMDIQTPILLCVQFTGHLHIQKSIHSSVHVKFGDNLRLDWDGRGRVLLKLGPKWAGRTCGLCGNYNGNQGDDFLSGSGLVETGPQAFGQSWRINGDCEYTQKYETDPCATNPKRVHFAEEACAVMMSDVFSPCHFLVNPGPFLRFCRYDVCACVDGEECLCSALSAYAAACAAKGVLLNWRSPSLCALECPRGQVYEACGNMCDRTCRALSGAESGCDGERVCEEGCFCPVGKYLSDSGECVTTDLCTCLHDGQLYQPNDVYADHNSICYCEKGSMRCSSTEKSTLLSDLFYDDDLAPSRERRSAQCPPPLVHAQCDAGDKGLECARTCQNLDLPCISLACIPGCLCPPGTVRHRRDCIAPEQCPCYHNNRPYTSGQTITVDCNTCVCENRKWRCTEKLCDGVCRTVGEAHYITFDGLKYSFPGLCQYVLVQDMCNGEEGSFRVLVENEACGIVGHRCAKAITVFYNKGLIVMEHGEVKMKRPVLQGSQVEIVRSGHFYTLLLGKHISISWDKGTRLLVHVSATYRNRVCGLCGNFDGNVNNDLMSSNNQLEVDSFHFGNSWKVVPSCADVTQIPLPCSDNIVKLVTVEQSCRMITGPLFRECNSQVNAEPYVEMCVEAACSCTSVGDCACFCDVIAAYAQACSERGVSVSWRSNDLCPMSCEALNPKSPGVGEELCQWRYNTCGPACPITCQHPDPLHCSLTCVEGCHAYCPPGQLLDEVAMRCVDPSQCQVCIHEGQRISHGNKVILNHDDPDHCRICHCENNTLSCEVCTSFTMFNTPTPTPTYATFTTLPFTTLMPEGTCDRAMDLAFLLDGSEALREDEFQATKEFILGVVERFRMGSAHTRATVLLYHSGVKTYDLQWLFKKTVRELHYTGGDGAFLDEAVKYLVINIYDKNKRENAGRVAIILTASANPRPVRAIVKMLRKKAITTLTVALGPEVNMAQINDITKANPENRAYVLSSTAELPDRMLDLTDYLCTLGMDPEVAKPPTPKLTPNKARNDVTFILEGSDSVGEVNFNKSLLFLEEVISQLTEEEELIRITIIQYSVTVTVEISRWELQQQRTLLLQRLREIRWKGGSKTNTGAAITTTFQEMATVQPSHGPTPPQLVFLVTENPPTDTVTRPPTMSTQTHVYPIGVGPKVRDIDLLPFSSPQRPMMVDDYNSLKTLVHHVVNITRTTVRPLPCKKPVDVLFLLKAGEQLEDMKTFVKTFINNADIGLNGTQVSVVQYGDTNTAELTWKDAQSKSRLLSMVGIDTLSQIPLSICLSPGSALRFAVQTCISPLSGGRVGVAKVVVMLVTDKSADDVKEAINEALAAGVSVFPIGVGPGYDRTELSLLGHQGNQDNTLHLNSMDQLLMLLSLDRGYTERICRGPGESWLLEDGCHSLLCHPSGAVTVQNHKVSCDRLEPPACRNNMPPVRVQETCSCHWECPCICVCMLLLRIPLALPWRYGGLEVVRYGGVMLQLKSDYGFVLTFTPQSNEFTITLLSSSTAGHTAGLCGACGEDKVNILSLRNGISTTSQPAFISDWTVAVDGGVCLPKKRAVCVSGAAMGCQALRSEVFEPCHAHIPVQVFLAKCEEHACEESDVCELISAYARLCKQRGVCVDWRSPHLCPLQCPSSMEYEACRTGGNESSCMDTPTEGCFCTGGTVLHHGQCVSPEACRQCVDHRGRTFTVSWVPDENPCLICMCLDQQHINCTARPCNDVKAPVCGPCEILREKRESKCCPEYECVCDLVNCDLPEVPHCEDGQTVILKNPGECQPIHECTCKKEQCDLQAPPACPSHRQLSVKKTKCCDVFECVCNCQNSTHTCPAGFITSSFTNDCGCIETSCLPDKVCVVGGVVRPVGSEWEEGCEKCSCTQLQDKETSMHIAQCTPPVCDRSCPRVSHTYEIYCTHCHYASLTINPYIFTMYCRVSHTVLQKESAVGSANQAASPHDKCVLHQCVKVKDEVFISATNVSCTVMDTPSCPLGTELRCHTEDCCPSCHCAPLDACVLNHTVIGAGERLMADVCTHCECKVEDGAVRKYKLSCRRLSCPSCPMVASSSRDVCIYCAYCTCVPVPLQVNTTSEDGCNLYTCGVNSKGDLVMQNRVTTCPPFNRQACLDEGGKISQIGTTCCEMCMEPECRRTMGTLNYIKVDDCQSEHQIELHYCEGKCRSKSIYSLERAAVEQECVCCAAVKTDPLSVPILCANGTRSHHTVLSVTACDCLSKHCS